MCNVDTICRRYNCPHLNKVALGCDICTVFTHTTWKFCHRVSHCSILARILEKQKKAVVEPVRVLKSSAFSTAATDELVILSDGGNTTHQSVNTSDCFEFVCVYCNTTFITYAACEFHMKNECPKRPIL